MSEKRNPTLQQIAADRDWWLQDSGAHYRELAGWLREVAGKCRLPNAQRELLDLARRYEIRADHLENRTRQRCSSTLPTKRRSRSSTLTETIEADRYPLSPRIQMLRSILAKFGPMGPIPPPPPRPPTSDERDP